MNIKNNNSNNKGWGYVGKLPTRALRAKKVKKVTGDKLGKVCGSHVEEQEISPAFQIVWGKPDFVPNFIHTVHQGKLGKSTIYPHFIHIQGSLGRAL